MGSVFTGGRRGEERKGKRKEDKEARGTKERNEEKERR
jgi:hypothetical protein